MLLIVCVYYHTINLKYLNTADVDSNSGGDTDMDVNALDASQHLEGISNVTISTLPISRPQLQLMRLD